MALLYTVLLLGAAIYFLYRKLTWNWNFFKERGIPYEQPVPILGNGAKMLTAKGGALTSLKEFYLRNKHHKVMGFYNFGDAVFMVNDPALIKKITVKEFEDFPNHHPFFETNQEPMLDGMLTIMKDQRWKDMRNTLTPVFTAAKMRAMFVLMNECFLENLEFLKEKAQLGENVELKDCFARLSNDLIATTAFGLKVNSYKHRDNEFYRIGQSITNFRGAQMLKFLLVNAAPKIARLLNIQIFSKDMMNYFKKMVIDAMKYRREHNIVRPDMIQLMMEAKEQSTQNWSDDEIAAQCFIFFFAAFENNATFLCFACHELMENPGMQERLYEEVLQLRDQLNGAPLDYDAVSKMKYMDMVLSETLRKWTLAPLLDRVCGRDNTLSDDDGNVVMKFIKGDRIVFPITGLHLDDEYFPNAEVFDPERFSDENKNNIKPFTYLPFGVGPRMCIGNRYALMQAKAMLYYLLIHFKMERCEKTADNILDTIQGFLLTPKSGFWMRLSLRK